MRLENKVAIVTGAASGIGAATAQLFAAEGARVLVVDLQETGLHDNHGATPHIDCLAMDITHAQAPDTIIGEAINRFGQLDILMNNAGIGSNAPGEDMAPEVWQKTLDVNLTASFRLCQAAIPHLKNAPAGRIINVASVMAQHTDYGLSAYSASKAGVTGYTRTLALELGKFGITANCILPGAIHTGMTAAGFANNEIADIWAKKSPLRRLGQPIDIARGALFLASDDGGFVTGHDLNVDGGMLLRT
ncbi:MAG TPA: NAD(P)-dependent oxidoreductase [Rhodobiaceae bacterium]|nr:NAD(P)-dependent oxidoreductase [Rhodobiaceae bacterium]|tara:strand:+ start:157 stop:897 length:741 start_codon:yes stop_codon:yes gene_type:complete